MSTTEEPTGTLEEVPDIYIGPIPCTICEKVSMAQVDWCEDITMRCPHCRHRHIVHVHRPGIVMVGHLTECETCTLEEKKARLN